MLDIKDYNKKLSKLKLSTKIKFQLGFNCSRFEVLKLILFEENTYIQGIRAKLKRKFLLSH